MKLEFKAYRQAVFKNPLGELFSGKKTESLRETVTADTSFTEPTGSAYSAAFQPLIGLNFSLKKDVSMNVRYSLSSSIKNSFGTQVGTRKTNTSNFSLTMSYSRRTGIRLPFPILKDMKLDNNINFSLSFDKGVIVVD